MSTQLTEPVLTCNLFMSVDRHRGLQIESQGERHLLITNTIVPIAEAIGASWPVRIYTELTAA